MSDLGYEHGKDVIASDDKRPVLYDASGRGLVRLVGFRPASEVVADALDGGEDQIG